jgi:hypothetical protein
MGGEIIKSKSYVSTQKYLAYLIYFMGIAFNILQEQIP